MLHEDLHEELHEMQGIGPRSYRNNEKMIALGDQVWQSAEDTGLINIKVDHESNNALVDSETNHRFMMLCSCSYLGLNRHPAVLEGAISAIREVGTTSLALAEVRVRLNLLGRFEAELREHFGTPVLPGLSCSAITAGVLPLLASGHLVDGKPRVMVFDKHSHFSMAYIKPICADEAMVLTAPHNDLNYIEDICKKYPRVTYVADGAYSMGDVAVIDGLKQLQDRYGLYLYLDDSHALSIMGTKGEGFVRSKMEMNPLTMVTASLGKAFGTSGGIAMLGDPKAFNFLYRHAGPVTWSQNMDVPAIGASLASLAIHRSPELGELQAKLQRNIDCLDRHFPTENAGNRLPIRKIPVGDEQKAIALSRALYEAGYYCSAVFFPIVARGQAGVRIMMRADIELEEVERFCTTAKQLIERI